MPQLQFLLCVALVWAMSNSMGRQVMKENQCAEFACALLTALLQRHVVTSTVGNALQDGVP